MRLENMWLYQRLKEIYGEGNLTLATEPKLSGDHTFVPIRQGIDTIGWVGVRQNVISSDGQQLIQLLGEWQGQYLLQEENEEYYWRLFLQEDVEVWRDKWDKLDYKDNVIFGNIYINIDEDSQIDSETFFTLKGIVEGVLEQKSYVLPLYDGKYVWIVPDYPSIEKEWEILKGIVDTITSECLVNVSFFLGEPYKMPHDVRKKVKEELTLHELAIGFGWAESIVRWKDLIYLLLLKNLSNQELEQMVDKIIGPFREDNEMLHSIATFLTENLNISETAKKLYIHRNSLQYRLDKFTEKTGLDLRRFEESFKVYIAIKALGILHKKS